MGAFGLKTHIWRNNRASVFLLAMFPVLLIGLAYAGTLVWAGMEGYGVGEGLAVAAANLPIVTPFALAGAGVWFAIAWAGHDAMISAAMKSKGLSRTDAPRLYNMLENLCISRGMATPKLKIIETDAMNAFASGLREKDYTVTFTRGLLDALDDDEIEAVMAHELTHIRNRDVRLLVISVIFVGIISFTAELVARGFFHGQVSRASRNRRSGGGQAGVLILIAIAIVVLAYVLAILIRFALSRKREYLADAGAVELTKNPDAMIGALQKISGKALIEDAPGEVREMFLYNPSKDFAGLFTTHPPIEKRIEALVEYAGGKVGAAQSAPQPGGPWG